MTAGFIVWASIGTVMIVLGIKALFAKKPAGFWANVRTGRINDVKGHNRATGLLFTAYGAVFILMGIPLLKSRNTPFILLSILGVVFETLAAMAVYSCVITKKYAAR